MKMHLNIFTSDSVGFLKDPTSAYIVARSVDYKYGAPDDWVYLDTVEINIKDDHVIRATTSNIEKAEARLEASYTAQKTELQRMKQELLAVEAKSE